jgi:ABC-type multidrug transport system ATPase subunit
VSEPAAALRADGVDRRFGSLMAVDGVTMRVDPGEVVGLLGANGAGKTTLIRLLLGLLPVSGGAVQLLGGPPDRERRRRLGYVPQGVGLYRDLTVRENVAFSANAYGIAFPSMPSELERRAGRLVRDLPLGFQRQLASFVAMAHDPQVLVLDEPTSGIDALAATSLWDVVHERAERGAGVLVTTHDMQEAQQCDRLLLMAGGRIVARGSEADVIGGTEATEVRGADWTRTFEALEAAGIPVVLSGRAVRVAGTDPGAIGSALTSAGIEAELVEVPATIEERMVVLARASGTATT